MHINLSISSEKLIRPFVNYPNTETAVSVAVNVVHTSQKDKPSCSSSGKQVAETSLPDLKVAPNAVNGGQIYSLIYYIAILLDGSS